MDIVFKCPVCQQELAVETTLAGADLNCPSCEKPITIPKADAPEAKVVDQADTIFLQKTPSSPASTSNKPIRVHSINKAPGEISHEDARLAIKLSDAARKIRTEVAKKIVGQDDVIEQLLIAIFARSHCLLEGVPGLAKTYMVKSVSEAMNFSFHRVQFTPDLMPADITGTDVIQEDPITGHRKLTFLKGPIFAQMILADEINRSPPKTQAALLEAMQEHSVTVGGQTFKLEEPFFVLATQNPVEQEGTYPLPEAQRDRFMFHVKVGYPSREQEREIIRRTTSAFTSDIVPVLTGEDVIECQRIVRKVPVPDHVMDFVLDLVRRSRPDEADALPFIKELVAWGPGPRACQQLVLGGKVRAVLQGRFHVTIDDIQALAYPVLRHRIVPTFNAEAEGIVVDTIIGKILEAIPKGEARNVF